MPPATSLTCSIPSRVRSGPDFQSPLYSMCFAEVSSPKVLGVRFKVLWAGTDIAAKKQ
jgi:hypothetical protein